MSNIVSPRGSTYAVETERLMKRFGQDRAVDEVTMRVPAGSVYGLLGPNGAGKSTMVRMLATLLRPDGGSASVFGRDCVRDADAVRRLIALTGQFASVDEDLTGRENLLVIARLLGYGRRSARGRTAELLDAFALADAADRSVKTYSGGMRRRLDIAASVIVRPQLLFLDEPTTGLDPQSRANVWELVRELVWEGTTVLLTTQYLEEADRLAHRLGVIDRGRLIAEGTGDQLKASLGQRALRLRLRDPDERDDAIRVLALALGRPVEREPDPVALSARLPPVVSDDATIHDVTRALSELACAGLSVAEFGIEQPTLDDVFLSLTGAAAHENSAATEDGAPTRDTAATEDTAPTRGTATTQGG